MWSEFAQLASAEMGNQNWKSWSKECDCFAQNYTYHGSMADFLLYQSITVVKPKLRMILLVQSGARSLIQDNWRLGRFGQNLHNWHRQKWEESGLAESEYECL